MGMFGRGGRAAAYDATGLERPNFGKQVLNQIGMNLLGVDFEGQRVADAYGHLQQKAAQEFEDQLKPGYSQGPQVGVTVPQMGETAEVPQFQLPERTRDPLNINSPELASTVARLGRMGIPVDKVLDVLKAQKPDYRQATDGTFYNPSDPRLESRRTANRANVNNTVVDLNDPDNTNRVVPSEPVKGAMPVYDNLGRVKDWILPPGARRSIGEASQAETTGRTYGSVFNRPNEDGTTSPTMGRDMFGGDGQGGAGGSGGSGRTQRPDDAAYAASVAKTAADQYNGIVLAGQKAGSSLTNYSRMKSLLDGLNTGKLTPAGLEFQKAAASVGLQPNPAWGRVEAADALSKKLALDAMGGSLGAGFSNADRSFVEAMNPSIMNTPQGRSQMIAFGEARARREQQISTMARQWQQRAGRLDKPDRNGKTFFDYLDAYAEANPLVSGR